MIKLTKEQRKISNANHKKAAEFFKLQKGWVLHHIDPDWRYNDIERYILWDPFDLVMMTNEEHTRIHQRGKNKSEEHRNKISESLKGKKLSEETKKKMSEARKGKSTWNKGLKTGSLSEETKKKISTSHKGKKHNYYSRGNKGMHWYNNGIVQMQSFECPNGFVPGRLPKSGT